MKSLWHAFCCLALCASAASAAEPVPAKSVQLSKVILDTDVPEIKGKLKVGTICLFSGGPLKPKKEKSTQNYERYDNLFSLRLKERGFNVVTTSSDLFAGEGDGQKADYLIGATIRPDTINLCSAVGGEKGDVTLAVEWQIYDRAAQKVVETVTTTGRGEQLKFAPDGLTRMFNDAFLANLEALVAQGAIQKHTGKPVPPT